MYKRQELAQAIVLPGVGAFPDAAEKLRATGLDQSVVKQGRKKPVLGICLGMQLLLDRGEEVLSLIHISFRPAWDLF